MSTPSKRLVAAASLLAMIISGCARNPGERLAQTAAETKAAAEVDVRIERQPDQCGQRFELLPEHQMVGQEQAAIIKRYEAMIEGPVNDRIVSCFQFNDKIYRGLRQR